MHATLLLLALAAAPPVTPVYPASPVALPEGHKPADPWYSWEPTGNGTHALFHRGRQVGWADAQGRYFPAIFRRGLAHFGPACEPPTPLPVKGLR